MEESLHRDIAREESSRLDDNQNNVLDGMMSQNGLLSKDWEPIPSNVSSKSERHPVGTNSGSPRKTSAIVLHYPNLVPSMMHPAQTPHTVNERITFTRSMRLLSPDCREIISEAEFNRLTKPIEARSAAPLEKNGFMAARMVRCLFGSVTESSKAAPP
jgi:hypothetical protein